ncbi:MAG TPA: hypothetical protein VFO94_05885 [Gammaproteobacteria bacterium]|nr:hypothetical protein [Gammaproteobacteria bacterium]
MKLPYALLLLALPVCAGAAPIFIEYSGKITKVAGSEPPPYSVGDPIHGSLMYDTTLVPPDLAPELPGFDLYRVQGDAPPVDFLTGFNPPSSRGADSIDIENDAFDPEIGLYDFFQFLDHEPFTVDGLSKGIAVRGVVDADVMAHGGLLQSFEATRADGLSRMYSYMEWIKDTVTTGYAEFKLSWISVKPGMCRR